MPKYSKYFFITDNLKTIYSTKSTETTKKVREVSFMSRNLKIKKRRKEE